MRLHQIAVGTIAAVSMIALSQSTASAQVYVQTGPPIVVTQSYGGGYYQPYYSTPYYGPRYVTPFNAYGVPTYGYRNANYGYRPAYGLSYGSYGPGFGYNRGYYSRPGVSFGFNFR